MVPQRLAVHERDFTVLGLVVGDDGGKVGRRQILAQLIPDDGAELVQELALVEPVFTVTTDLSNDVVELSSTMAFWETRLPPSGL